MRRLRVFALLLVALFASTAASPAAASPDSGQVTGIVRDEQGRVIAHAPIRLYPAVPVVEGAPFLPTTPVAMAGTDAAGRYSFDVPAGAYDLAITGQPGGAPYTATVRGIDVAAGGTTAVDVAIVRPPVAFRGRVVDAKGAGIPARLTLEVPPTRATEAETTATPDGYFTLMAPRGEYMLAVRADFGDVLVTAQVPKLTLSADRTETLTFPLGDVDVTVGTDDGLPAGHVYLGCFDGCEPATDLFSGADARMTFASSGQPDGQGRLRLRGFAATGARVIVPETDALRGIETYVPLAVPGTLVVHQRRIGPTVTFQGTLKDGTGTPLNGHVTVTGEDGYSVTDEVSDYAVLGKAPGGFTLAVPPGRYRLDVSANVETVWDQLGVESGIYVDGLFVTLDNFDLTAARTVDLTVPITDFPVTVLESDGRPAAGVKVVGTSGQTDKPDVGDAAVEIFPGGVGRGRLINEEARTDATGVAHLNIFPGAAPPTLRATQGLTAAQKSVARGAADAEMRLPPRRQIQGQLRDVHGPLPGAVRVDVSEATGRPVGSIDDIREDGTWGFTAPDGRYTVRFGYPWLDYDSPENPPNTHRPATWWIDTKLDVAGGVSLDVTLPDTAPADVFVHDTDGSPAKHALVTSATTTGASVALAPGLSGRGSAESDDRDVVATGHLRSPLFGPSEVRLWLGRRWFSD
ncbi:MAG TPA: carboxypeptidase regulatory-like domain-containing protein, partial [Acidimicrobiia bacterium]|nr:carboxypeptidase regulatory-like domain-containing protein [Acidimicrobiia bacterium]